MDHRIDAAKWGFEGFVLVRLPNFDECCEVMEMTQALKDEQHSESMANIKTLRKTVGWSKQFYLDVSVKVGDREFKSFDDLSSYKKTQIVITDVAIGLMNGFEDAGN